ncbi:hypothetical protein [Oxynema aestuarii]|jgi:hypothetical protein|uniref:Glycine-rich protein n=1 Tax=Oxynema aestuarii AP17 TaxID=2064643 RepID=A0A6H1TWI2_9CYAN|nr:hypothetical protein [Oxynema aestuarii]QIZ70123.1 hypothetical protein HCG48_05680 [Oxynema aestuarii AP17]RMH72694.1 MAG: hypothetical protein D6680_18380 [Cyanobacteria bacterium J007]
MWTKIFALFAILLAIATIGAAYTQSSALTLRQEQQSYWPRHRTYLHGSYRSGSWNYSRDRSDYGGGFFGGGSGVGK